MDTNMPRCTCELTLDLKQMRPGTTGVKTTTLTNAAMLSPRRRQPLPQAHSRTITSE